jgi:hypothetical protein
MIDVSPLNGLCETVWLNRQDEVPEIARADTALQRCARCARFCTAKKLLFISMS